MTGSSLTRGIGLGRPALSALGSRPYLGNSSRRTEERLLFDNPVSGLARDPALPAGLLRRIADRHLRGVQFAVLLRPVRTDEQVRALATHPEVTVRMVLAEAAFVRPEQRATLVEDADRKVLLSLVRGPESVRNPRATRTPDRGPRPRPDLPADLVRRLAVDPDPGVRLAVSLRAELTEEERTAIGCVIGPDDRVPLVSWALAALDEATQRKAALSAHIGLRRSAARNPGLAPDLAKLADDPNPEARKLVALDPEAPPELIERLSTDPEPRIRQAMAADPRLSPGRLTALFDDLETAGSAAANPNLPEPLMRRILDEAEASRA